MVVSANWRLENAKSPAAMLDGVAIQSRKVTRVRAMLQENNPDATRMSIPRMYLVSCCICDVIIMSASKLVTAELLSLG